jgi:hypothetical protein
MNDTAGPTIESAIRGYLGCESCSSVRCPGDCELSRADAAIEALLAEQAAFAAERAPFEPTPCCDLNGAGGEHDRGCDYADDVCDCVEINERIAVCASCREGAL